MFSHSVISQESQVLAKPILTDSVLSPHRCEFQPQRKEEELVSGAVKDLEAEMWDKSFSRPLMEILSEKRFFFCSTQWISSFSTSIFLFFL